MTLRQNKLGVTEYGYNRGIKQGEFLADIDCFKAKISTVKKGQYHSTDIIKMWFPEYSQSEIFIKLKSEQIKPFLFGLSATMNQYFDYSDTHGLDLLTIK